MLILKRKPGEAFSIGDSIVRVLSIDGLQVKIGIEAPSHVKILRTELENTRPAKLTAALETMWEKGDAK